GSLSYQLENVTINIDKPVLSAQDSIVLRGLTNGQATLTSSVNAFFLRNSANSPFYPTGGSRSSIELELAGGPFGGSVNFMKARIEGRTYFRSLIRGVATMLRARVGFLAEYPDQHLDVPPYERFRLGGGTTPDPLRGYDDYMVVPSKFITVVNNGFTIDSLTTPGVKDTVYHTNVVRYPG